MLFCEVERWNEDGTHDRNPWRLCTKLLDAVRDVVELGGPALYAVYVQGGFVPTYDAALYIEVVDGPGGNYVDPDLQISTDFEQIIWECGDPMKSYRVYTALPAPKPEAP